MSWLIWGWHHAFGVGTTLCILAGLILLDDINPWRVP